MIVYRVENFSNIGPYAPDWIDSERNNYKWTERSHNAPSHPSPAACPILSPTFGAMPWAAKRDYYFGFGSLAQLEAWFSPEELTAMEELGLRVVQYETDDCIVGERQAVFRLETARMIQLENRKAA